jgi:23S rRNA G2445 N2-methylase RlmL
LYENIVKKEKIRIISNPPYWKRITSPNLEQLYTKLKNSFTWNIFWGWISSIEGTSIKKDFFSSKKLYNWAEECHFYRRKPN